MTLNKKRIIQIGGTVFVVLFVGALTVFALRQLGLGNNGLQSNSSSNNQSDGAQVDTSLSGTPAELRQKGLDTAVAGDKEKALKYFEAAKSGFENSNDSVAIDEINMQIDQLKSTPINTGDNKFVSPESQKNDPSYITQ